MNKVEDYKILDERSHVLMKPGMYVGSIVCEKQKKYIYEDNKFEEQEIDINPAFIKIFDEILSNSIDESKRNPKLNNIKVKFDKYTGEISIFDNGGIPVEFFNKTKKYIPEVIFSTFRSGSNFNDNDNRVVAGTNGFGAVLTNVFSSKFIIETCDGKKLFKQEFLNNMNKIGKPKISNSSKKYTKITYIPDFIRFGMKNLDDSSIKMIEKHVYDAAACNSNVKISLNEKILPFKSFNNYCKLYIHNDVDFFFEKNDMWEVGIAPSKNGFQQISFVNSVETYDGGRHVDMIVNQIIEYMRDKISKKYKYDLKPSEIKNHLFLFINCTIINPAFSSQTKEKLITEPKNFGSTFTFSEKCLKDIYKSEIVNNIVDWIEEKKNVDEKSAIREANKKLERVKINKLVDAKGKKREKCIFFIAEGDSPLSAFRKFRNPEIHGALPIRGKIKNVYDINYSKALENDEIKAIFSSLGLRVGTKPDNMRYGEIAIMADSDVDGDDITALLLNIFYKFFPQLIDEKRIFRIQTPILAATSKNKTEEFYTQAEYDKWCEKHDSQKYEITYYKGLAALDDEQSKRMINDPKKFYFTKDNLCDDKFKIWFGNDSELRKKELLEYE